MLLTIPESDHTPVNYEMIFSYLSSQMPALDHKKLRKSLPRALAQIKRISAEGLDQNQELGLFLHIACAIDRLQNGEAMPEKGNRRASSAATSACTTICERSCPGLKKHLTFVSRTMSSHI